MASGFFDFQPNPDRAVVVDSRVRVGLALSLLAVFQALAGAGVPRAEKLSTRVRSAPVLPALFAIYTELVEAIFDDEIDLALSLARELEVLSLGQSGDLRILNLSDDDLGKGQSARYTRLLDDDPNFRLELRPLAPATFSTAATRVNEALALLTEVMPDLSGEIRNLVRQIILVDSNDTDFGATSFQIWGALFLRLKDQWGRIEIIEALAHESAHALLFGFALGKPLVRNEPEKLYASPLRSDPRPMDGVVHASYVLARMHYALSQLVASGLLTKEEELLAGEARRRNAQRYYDGCMIVDGQAVWTPEGKAALSSARAYMANCY